VAQQAEVDGAITMQPNGTHVDPTCAGVLVIP
jgi:hypothetical protein